MSLYNQYEAVVVGAGPNGLSAAIRLRQAGLSVLLVEGNDTIGGGVRSEELMIPGVVHDICSAIHPLAASSPFLKTLPLHEHGLEFIYPEVAAAHPLENGQAGILYQSLDKTIQSLDKDGNNYNNLIGPIVKAYPKLIEDVLDPLRFPKHPYHMARFGWNAIRSGDGIAKKFNTELAKGLWGGVAAHAIHRLNAITTGAIGLVLMATAHAVGWPLPKGGAGNLSKSMLEFYQTIGGEIITGWKVKNIDELPPSKILMLDVTPKQMLEMTAHRFSNLYLNQLKRYKYGMGVFKVDWILDGPVPFKNEEVRKAGTVHIGNTYQEISFSEYQTARGIHPQKPFVLMAQQASIDGSRTHSNYHPVWGYCHVPNGSTIDMTDAIENQIERFAPGFKDRILYKVTSNTAQMESYNPNYIGGDINGGLIDVTQLFTRPALRPSPYRTSAKGIYICSSSTPPGGGVHGMCGFNAANKALKDIYGITLS